MPTGYKSMVYPHLWFNEAIHHLSTGHHQPRRGASRRQAAPVRRAWITSRIAQATPCWSSERSRGFPRQKWALVRIYQCVDKTRKPQISPQIWVFPVIFPGRTNQLNLGGQSEKQCIEWWKIAYYQKRLEAYQRKLDFGSKQGNWTIHLSFPQKSWKWG